jgi:hypothetical protein
MDDRHYPSFDALHDTLPNAPGKRVTQHKTHNTTHATRAQMSTRLCGTPGCTKRIHHGGLHTCEARRVEARINDRRRANADAVSSPLDTRYAPTSATLPEVLPCKTHDVLRGDRLVQFVSPMPCFRPLYVHAPGTDGRMILEHHADGSSHVLTADEEWAAHTSQLGRDGLLQYGIEITHSDEGVLRFAGCILEDECQMLRVRNAQYRRLFASSYAPGRP